MLYLYLIICFLLTHPETSLRSCYKNNLLFVINLGFVEIALFFVFLFMDVAREGS